MLSSTASPVEAEHESKRKDEEKDEVDAESDQHGEPDERAQQEDKHNIEEDEDRLVGSGLHRVEHNVLQETPDLRLTVDSDISGLGA